MCNTETWMYVRTNLFYIEVLACQLLIFLTLCFYFLTPVLRAFVTLLYHSFVGCCIHSLGLFIDFSLSILLFVYSKYSCIHSFVTCLICLSTQSFILLYPIVNSHTQNIRVFIHSKHLFATHYSFTHPCIHLFKNSFVSHSFIHPYWNLSIYLWRYVIILYLR